MKKLTLFFVLSLFSFSFLQAQISKGTILLGGGAGFQNSKLDIDGTEASNSVFIAPMALYFITNQFAAGGNIGFNYAGSDGESISQFSFNPEVRGYFSAVGNANFFLSGSIGVLREKSDFTFGGENSATALVLGLGPGVDVFINKHVALEVYLGYNRIAYEEVAQNSIGLQVGIAAFFGGTDEK